MISRVRLWKPIVKTMASEVSSERCDLVTTWKSRKIDELHAYSATFPTSSALALRIERLTGGT